MQKRVFPIVEFIATLGPDDDASQPMSKLHAKAGGKCDHVSTYEGSRGCGLAAYMMATCFQDSAVLGSDGKGHDVESDPKWNEEPQRDKASALCQSMIFLRCFPDANTPKYICISYLRAATLAHYDIVFMKKPRVGKMQALELGESLENTFKENPESFVKENGFTWFFCKCVNNPGLKKDCLSMVAGKLGYYHI